MSAALNAPARDRRVGVRIAGCGSAVPQRLVTNQELESLMDTSDEWIVQRTGIRERRVADRASGETTEILGAMALRAALTDARLAPADVDLVLTTTMTASMPTPSSACMISNEVGCGAAGAFDLNGACCGFVFGLNVAHELIRGGMARTVALVGTDTLTQFVEFSTLCRNSAILFGDAASAMILRADDDTTRGVIAQAMHADGGRACHLYIPRAKEDFYNPADYDPRLVNRVHMNGQAVFKFAVLKFPEVIQETLDKAGLMAGDVDLYVCHQANTRILEAARERFGLAPERLPINIDRYGNTVAASIPLLFDELKRAGRIHEGQRVMFLAFGAGLTWGASLWKI